ncbi:MAG: winged helix-turn-helix transcriptional regulator [Candidatus Hydrogenedentes bacterium]|nr:winged helix-turn-helix transcriptional regulator [Candidatus Hydrogenedentota bacterium]
MHKETTSPLDWKALSDAALCLRTLAHPHRLRMVQLMLKGRYTVNELAEECDIPQHVASEHLGKMKDRGLLKSERDGRCTYYRVAAPGLAHIMKCVKRHFG